MARTEEYKSANPDEVVGVRMQHNRRHLTLLVAGYIDATLHAKCCKLVVLFILMKEYT